MNKNRSGKLRDIDGVISPKAQKTWAWVNSKVGKIEIKRPSANAEIRAFRTAINTIFLSNDKNMRGGRNQRIPNILGNILKNKRFFDF